MSEKACTVQPDLTAVTDAEGKFVVPNVNSGEYAVLYNSSGDQRTEWLGLDIHFVPVQGEVAAPLTWGIVDWLGVEASACNFQVSITGLGTPVESGNLYFRDLDLGLILVESEPVSVNAQAGTVISLSVWSTQDEECDTVNFHPAIQETRALYEMFNTESSVAKFSDMEYELISKTATCAVVKATGTGIMETGETPILYNEESILVWVRQGKVWVPNAGVESCD